VFAVLHFLGEDIGRIDFVRNKMHSNILVDDVLFDSNFTDVKIFHVFADRILAPFDGGLIVIVHRCRSIIILEREVAAF